MSSGFALASLWQVVCSTIGGLCASALRQACPHCAPVLRCPALSCHCGGGSELIGRSVDTTCLAAGGCPWQLVAAAFAAGLVTAALGILSLQLWVRTAAAPLAIAGPASAASPKGTLGVLAAAAAADTAGVSPRRPPPPPASAAVRPVPREPLPTAVLPETSSPHDEGPVWKPRR